MVSQSKSILLLFTISLSIAGGRWGSWMGIPSRNVFIIDLLLVLCVFWSFKNRFISIDLLVAFFLGIYIVSQIIIYGEYSKSVVLRDLAPFIYLFIFVCLRSSALIIPHKLLFKYLRIATLFSLTWNLGRSLGVVGEFNISGLTGVPVFSERSDQFGFVACIGIIVWTEKKFSYLFRPTARNIIVLLFLLTVSLLPGRAGGIASLLSLIYLLVSRDLNKQGNRILARRAIYGLITVVLLGGIISNIFPDSSSLKRSGVIQGTESSRISGQGTINARIEAQKLVLKWTFENELEVFGAGPGREIVLESGAYKWLSGSVDVRQPHNWWVSLFSRFGFFGFFYWTFMVIYYLKPLKRANLMQPRIFILGAILITSTFGVILESPFGLIPFYFFLMRNRDDFSGVRQMPTR